MKHYALTVLGFLIINLCTNAQQLASGEYFFDTDPGFGSGTAIAFTGADSVNMLTTINVSSLSTGFHHLYLRTKTTAGKWSHYEGRSFYIIEAGTQQVTQPSLQRGEYFYDTDPGFGNGTSIAFTTTDSVNMTANISTVGQSTGFHDLFIRTRNTAGKWSHYEGRMLYIIEAGTQLVNQPSLVKAEYFFDTDPGLNNGTNVSFATADSVNMWVNINTTGLSNGVHNVFLRTKNANGKWSHYEGREFTICTSVIPGTADITTLSGLDILCDGHTETFLATLQNEGNNPIYQWKLNGTEVSVASTYAAPSSLSNGDELILAVISSDNCISPNPLRDTISISVIDTVFATEDVTICSNQSYLLPNGSTVSTQGQYFSYLSAVNSCDSVVITDLTVDVCTGMEDGEAVGFSIYPNPSSGFITLSMPLGNYRLEVFSAMGQLVHAGSLQGTSNHAINLSNVAKGVYTLLLSNAEQMYSQHIILQ